MLCCCYGREKRKIILKQRCIAELKYEEYRLSQKRPVNIACGSASAIGSCVVVSVAAAPATCGASATIAAVLAVLSSLQILTMACYEEEYLCGIRDEIERRKSK